MKPLTTDEARRFIAGEQFDAEAYEKEHINRLYRSGLNAAADPAIDRHNLARTVGRWIANHANTPHRAELGKLVALRNQLEGGEQT